MDSFDSFINLSNFYAIFVALNLAYSGSKTFRLILNEDILKLNASLDKLTNDLDAFVARQPNKDTQGILVSLISRGRRAIISREENAKFEKIYKELFSTSAIFCIGMVLLLGLSDSVYCEFLCTILTFSILLFILNGYIFASGFTNKNNDPIVGTLSTVMVLLIQLSIYLLGFAAALYNHHIENIIPQFGVVSCIYISIIIAVLPYVLFVTKAYLYREKNKTEGRKFLDLLTVIEENLDQDLNQDVNDITT